MSLLVQSSALKCPLQIYTCKLWRNDSTKSD